MLKEMVVGILQSKRGRVLHLGGVEPAEADSGEQLKLSGNMENKQPGWSPADKGNYMVSHQAWPLENPAKNVQTHTEMGRNMKKKS